MTKEERKKILEDLHKYKGTYVHLIAYELHEQLRQLEKEGLKTVKDNGYEFTVSEDGMLVLDHLLEDEDNEELTIEQMMLDTAINTGRAIQFDKGDGSFLRTTVPQPGRRMYVELWNDAGHVFIGNVASGEVLHEDYKSPFMICIQESGCIRRG